MAKVSVTNVLVSVECDCGGSGGLRLFPPKTDKPITAEGETVCWLCGRKHTVKLWAGINHVVEPDPTRAPLVSAEESLSYDGIVGSEEQEASE